MSSPDAFTVIEQTLRAGWTVSRLVFENEDYPLPGTPAHFVYVEVFGDFYRQGSIGAEPQADNLWREGGMVYLHVMTPNGIGSTTARQHARQLVGLFRGEEIDGVRFGDASIGQGDPGRSFGNYFALTATIEWELDS